MCGVLSDSSLFYRCQVIDCISKLMPEQVRTFLSVYLAKKKCGQCNAFYFSITKICEPYKKIRFIFVFKIKYSLTNWQPTWNVSKDWFFNYLIIQYEQNSYIHLWRGYVCTSLLYKIEFGKIEKKNFIFKNRKKTFVPLWSEFDVCIVYTSLKSSKLDKRLGM